MAEVGIIMGSQSDWPTMKDASLILTERLGGGIVILPAGRLVRGLQLWRAPATTFDTGAWAVYPSRSFLPAKVREMIDFLVAEKGLSRDEAYVLCSLAADLHVTQAVDQTKGVHATIAKSIFK